MRNELIKLKDKLINLNSKNQLVNVSSRGRYYLDMSEYNINPDILKNWLLNRESTSLVLDETILVPKKYFTDLENVQTRIEAYRNQLINFGINPDNIDTLLEEIEAKTDEINTRNNEIDSQLKILNNIETDEETVENQQNIKYDLLQEQIILKEQLNKINSIKKLVNEINEEYENEDKARRAIVKAHKATIKKFKNIIDRSVEIRKQTGKFTLYMGYAFFSCLLKTGLIMNAPMVLYPLDISINQDSVIIRHNVDRSIIYNRTALLAIYNYLGIKATSKGYVADSLLELCNSIDTLDGIIDGIGNITKPSEFNICKVESIGRDIRSRKLYHGLMYGVFNVSSSIYLDYEAIAKLNNDNRLIGSLFSGDDNTKDYDINSKYSNDDIHTISRLDKSQEYAVYMSNKSSNLVIYGPPGTGKSQVILNIIADQTYNNKNILLVSQKLTALNVVYNRLGALQMNTMLVDDASARDKFVEHITAAIENKLDYNYQKDIIKLHSVDEELDDVIGRLDTLHSIMTTPLNTTGVSLSFMYRNSKLTEDIESIAIKLRTKYPDIFKYRLREIYDAYNYNITKSSIDAYKNYTNINLVDKLSKLSRLDLKMVKETIKIIENLDNQIKDVKKHIDPGMIGGESSESFKKVFNSGKFFYNIQSILNSNFFEFLVSNVELPEVTIDYSNRIVKDFDNTLLLNFYNNVNLIRYQLNKIASDYGVELNRHNNINSIREYVINRIENYFKTITENINYLIGLYQQQGIRVSEQLVLNDEEFENTVYNLNSFIPNKQSFIDRVFYKSADNQNNLNKITSALLICPSKLEYEKNKALNIIENLENNYKNTIKDIDSILNQSNNYMNKLSTYLDEQLLFNKELNNLLDNRSEQLSLVNSLGLDYDNLINKSNIISTIDDVLSDCDTLSIINNLDDCSKLILEIYTNENIQLEELVNAYLLYNIDLLESNNIGSNIMIEYKSLISRVNTLEDTKNDLIKRLIPDIINDGNSGTSDIEISNMIKDLVKTRKAKSIRQIISDYTEAIYGLFHIWMMTPETVSDILPLERDRFDVVIFDEASQLYLENAIPALYRSKKAIIAGDEKQLKPTSFFITRQSEDDTEDDEDEIIGDSLLDQAKVNFNSVNLNFHYRSKYAELIQFSNYAFYKSQLKIAPNTLTPNSEIKPIEYINVHGHYDKGGNVEEAQYIVNLLKDIITTDEYQQDRKSIGIITFNIKQKECIEDTLDEFLVDADDKTKACFAEIQNRTKDGEDLSLFIKNLEDVQGDERDIIIFSAGFGYDTNGKLSLRFGPLGLAGGENRLNVAISRAKEKEYVITSIDYNELNVSSARNNGPKIFKQFLEYAKAVSDKNYEVIESILNPVDLDAVSINKFDSKVEEEIYNGLIQLGWKVDTNVGLIGYRVSLAVYDEKSGNYIAGIETDNSEYARLEDAKERDIGKLRFLEGKGWNIIRVWSKNWWHNSKAELERIDKILKNIGEDNNKSVLEKEVLKPKTNEIGIDDIIKLQNTKKFSNLKQNSIAENGQVNNSQNSSKIAVDIMDFNLKDKNYIIGIKGYNIKAKVSASKPYELLLAVIMSEILKITSEKSHTEITNIQDVNVMDSSMAIVNIKNRLQDISWIKLSSDKTNNDTQYIKLGNTNFYIDSGMNFERVLGLCRDIINNKSGEIEIFIRQ